MRVGVFLFLLLAPLAAMADPVRIATFHTGLSARGPGLMLRDLLRGEGADAVAAIDAVQADILVLQDVDYDLEGRGLAALADRLAVRYPYRFARRPNTGMPTGLDLDGDGQRGGPADAQGFGFFSGQGGMAILSRFPVLDDQVRDFSAMLWSDLPNALLYDGMPDPTVQRLSSVGHWDVPVALPDGTVLHVLAFHATTPVFDGPEDRNGRRNADEIRFWQDLVAGGLPVPAPPALWVIAGVGNVDPERGEGRRDAIAALLADPALTDPLPGRVTADYPQTGPLRLDYVLPMAGLTVLDAGVGEGAPHRPVWVDLAF